MKYHIDQPKNKTESKRPPKTCDMKSRNYSAGHHHKKSVYYKREQSQSNDLYRQSENNQNRTDDRVQKTQHYGNNKRHKKTLHKNCFVRQKICGNHDRQCRQKPMYDQLHCIMYKVLCIRYKMHLYIMNYTCYIIHDTYSTYIIHYKPFSFRNLSMTRCACFALFVPISSIRSSFAPSNPLAYTL